MKKYHLFAGYNYNSFGGMYEYQKSSCDKEYLVKYIKNHHPMDCGWDDKFDWYQIVDSSDMKVIEYGNII